MGLKDSYQYEVICRTRFNEMLKYQAEKNWANNIHELRGKYNLPPNDENVCNLTYSMSKNGT